MSKSLHVDAYARSLMHRNNRRCVARCQTGADTADDEHWESILLQPARLMPGRAGDKLWHYATGSLRETGGVIAFFSPLAERFECRGVVVRSNQPGEPQQTRCPACTLR
ncbi:MAG: hypothetical protein J0H09_08550 [Burkholderiales bacterium]|nr:hypothetical protein [Burkholderiales bacterium]